jgi:hypothetical protein
MKRDCPAHADLQGSIRRRFIPKVRVALKLRLLCNIPAIAPRPQMGYGRMMHGAYRFCHSSNLGICGAWIDGYELSFAPRIQAALIGYDVLGQSRPKNPRI